MSASPMMRSFDDPRRHPKADRGRLVGIEPEPLDGGPVSNSEALYSSIGVSRKP